MSDVIKDSIIKDGPHCVDGEGGAKLLSLKNLVCEIDSVDALSDISFDVVKGGNLVLFGPEDSGIDVLISAILGVHKDYTGSILYNGLEVHSFDYVAFHNYKKNIGYMHPDYGLISNMSVEQNISLPLEYHSTLDAGEIKEYVNMLIYELNLDYCKKFRPVNLTHSEVLKTAYARAIALDPDLLIVEHAIEGQSPLNIQTFLDHLTNRAKRPDKSVVFVTYEPEKFLDFADCFIMIFNGHIVFKGNRREFILSKNEYLKQYKSLESSGPMAIL